MIDINHGGDRTGSHNVLCGAQKYFMMVIVEKLTEGLMGVQ